MKTVVKLLVAFVGGIALGLAIAVSIIVIFTDTSLTEFIEKLQSSDVMEISLSALVGMASFLLSLAILIPVHEAGHLVCGLITGYKFVSFRIFNYTFIKTDGKIRIKVFSIAGTGGQCLLMPPKQPIEKISTGWYNAGGVLANILMLLLVSPLFMLDLHPLVFEVLVIFSLTDLLLILMNGIPFKSGVVGNDAYNMLWLRHNPLSKHAFVLQLRSNAMIQEGLRPKDMPNDWFENKTDIDYKNPFEVSIPLMHASRLIDKMQLEEAYHEFDLLYQHRNEMMQLYVNEIACELAFCMMATGRKEKAESLIDAKLRKYIISYQKVMSSKLRILCGIALYIEQDKEKAYDIYRSLLSSKDKYLLQGEVMSDLAIMERMLKL